MDVQVKSDAAGALGFGIYSRDRWCAGIWAKEWHQEDIMRDLAIVGPFGSGQKNGQTQ